MGELDYPLAGPLDCFYLFHYFSACVIIWFNMSFNQFLFSLLAEIPRIRGYGRHSVDDWVFVSFSLKTIAITMNEDTCGGGCV